MWGSFIFPLINHQSRWKLGKGFPNANSWNVGGSKKEGIKAISLRNVIGVCCMAGRRVPCRDERRRRRSSPCGTMRERPG